MWVSERLMRVLFLLTSILFAVPDTVESQPETWGSCSEAGSRPGTPVLGLADPRNDSPTLMQSAPVSVFTPTGSNSATPYMSASSSNTGVSIAAPTGPQEPTSKVTMRKTASWPPTGTTTKYVDNFGRRMHCPLFDILVRALYAREWYAKGGGTAEKFEVHWSLLSDEEKAKVRIIFSHV